MEGADVVEKNGRFDSFEETIIREQDGRYSTPIPWTTDQWRLGKNFKLSAGRMDSTLNRLRKDPKALQDYEREILQLIDRKFRYVAEADVNYRELHTYLPHHPVYRQDKATTKIRPVFDGAAKTKDGPSLNEVLETGPNFNPDLLSVLLRFRMNKIGWTADIEKAFLNISLLGEDTEALRFLWPKEPRV